MPSSIFDSNSVLPLWAVSSRANSSRRASSRSAVLASRRPRCRAESLCQPSESKQARAPLTAASTSAASPRATSAITSSVAGFTTGKRRAELLRVQQHLLPVVLRGQHLVDQAELLRPVEREQLALDHQLDRQRLAHDAGEPLRAPRAGQHAEVDLGETDLAGVLLRQPQ